MAADPGNYPGAGSPGQGQISKTSLLISVPINFAKTFGYPFPTVSDRVGLAFWNLDNDVAIVAKTCTQTSRNQLQTVWHIVAASCTPRFWSSISFVAPTISDIVGFEVAPKGRPGGIRASDLQAPSPNCLMVHPLDLPKISKIQNPQDPKSELQNSQIQNPKSPKSKIPQSPKSKIPRIQNPKSPKFGFWGF